MDECEPLPAILVGPSLATDDAWKSATDAALRRWMQMLSNCSFWCSRHAKM